MLEITEFKIIQFLLKFLFYKKILFFFTSIRAEIGMKILVQEY